MTPANYQLTIKLLLDDALSPELVVDEGKWAERRN